MIFTKSHYSLLQSSLKIKQIIEIAKDHNLKAVALCDTHNISGHVEFCQIALKNQIQPILGVEITLEDDTNLYIIAQNETGYKNLIKITSSHFINIETYESSLNKNKISYKVLEKYTDGLICLSRYIYGPLFKTKDKKEMAKYLNKIFNNNFLLEIFRDDKQYKKYEQEYVNLSKELQIPLIATNNILFAEQDDHYSHDIILCIKQNKKINDSDREIANKEHYFKSPEEMKELFKDLPSAITNIDRLIKKIHFFLEPSKPELPKFSNNEIQNLKDEAISGLKKKDINKSKEDIYIKRLNYELEILINKNFAGYFLIVSDFIKWAKRNDIMIGPGRGSGAGSLVAWCLDITDIDPIEFGLLFERFLNPSRESMPDFDIDICQKNRERVISYVKNKYGEDKVSQIITFGKMQAKAVIRDVAKALGLFFSKADYMSKLIPFNAVNPVTLTQAISEVPELHNIFHDKSNDPIKKLMKEVLIISLKLEGLIRNYSTHAAGIVIAKTNILDKTAIYEDHEGKRIIQLSMTTAEYIGLVKFDFLGLQNLTLIDNTIKMIKKEKNIDIKFKDFNDEKTYALLSMGLSIGIFQFESRGMQNYLKALEPTEINDLIALNSLYRPGPMDNIPSYMNRKKNAEEITYMHEKLEKCLKPTYGIMIYQEQVMESVQILANYTLAEADLLRRAIGKKKPAEMQDQKNKFIEGAKQNNISEEEAIKIFQQIEKFAGYGFNKSHAAAYSVIAYYTAYLKAHYTIYFFVSYFNLEANDTNKIMILLQDMKNFNIQIESIDINKSCALFKIINDKKISYSLSAIKGMNLHTAQLIEEERKKNGPFLGLVNFIERMPKEYFSKKNIDALIKSSAFDKIESMNQGTMLENITIIQDCIYNNQNNMKQFNLLNDNKYNIKYKNVEDLNLLEMSANEFACLGLYICYHPLDYYQDILNNLNIKNYNDINYLHEGYHDIQIAASILKKDNKFSKGKQFLILTLSDQTNLFELTVFDEEIIPKILKVQDTMIFTLKVYKNEGNTRIFIKNAVDINHITNYSMYINKNVVLHLKEEQLPKLKEYLDLKKINGNITIYLVLQDNHMKYKVKLKNTYDLNAEELEKQFQN